MKPLGLAALLLLAACSDGRGEPERPVAAPSEEGRGAVTFVAVGTDETEARDLDFPESIRSSWSQRLFRDALPRRSVHVNLAEAESSVADAVDVQLPAALELESTLVAVWLTATDLAEGTSVEDYEEDLGLLVDELQQGGRAQVLLATSTAARPAPDLDAAVERVARSSGADLVDLRDFDDDLDVEGHAQVAKVFASVLGEVR